MNIQSVLIILMISCVAACGTRMHEVIETDDDGKLFKKYTLDADQLKQGQLIQYTAEGKVAIQENYIDGNLSGERLIYGENDKIQIKEIYKAGVLNGPYVEYFDTGKPLIEATYSDNVMEGILTKYHPNGAVAEKVTFADNNENGPFTEYYDTGVKQWEGTYRNGDNEYGLLSEYNAEGELIRKMMCDSLAMCRSIWTIEKGDIK